MNKSLYFTITILGCLILSTNSIATELSDFIDKSKCSKIIDLKLYKICYSYKYKSALSGWVKLEGNLVNEKNIKKRPRFYSEPSIPKRYRTNHKDYTGYGNKWNRGHFIVADADFDYSSESLKKTYSMANIIPQSAKVNQKTYTKVERYGRTLAKKLGYINSVSIAKYENENIKIGNDIVIPTKTYRIYYNNDEGFEKCFEYKNELNIDYKNDKLKNHQIDCETIKNK